MGGARPLAPEPPFQSEHVARGAWYGLLAQGVDKILPVGIFLYLARTLSGAEFGTYAFILAYLTLFQVLAEQSLDTVLVRKISREPQRSGEILQAALGLRLVFALASALVATALSYPISGGQTSPWLVLLASLSLVTALSGAYRACFRATLDIRAVFLIAVARAVALGFAVVIAVSLFPGLPAIFLATAAANLIAFAVVAAVASRHLPFGLRVDWSVWRELAEGALPLAFNSIAITVSLRAGQIILMSLRGPSEVGLLGAAARVSESLSLLPEALMITMYPVMAGLYADQEARMLLVAERASRYLTMLLGAPVLVCVAAGASLMSLLFGAQFSSSGAALAILAGAALISAHGVVIVNVLIASHREKILYRNTMVFSLINVLLCFPLIIDWGYTGAAVAMLITSVASQICLALLPGTAIYVRACLKGSSRPLAAVAVAAAVTFLSGSSGGAGVALILFIFVVSLVMFRSLSRKEWRYARLMLAPLFRS